MEVSIMDDYVTPTATIIGNQVYCGFCDGKMKLVHIEFTPAGFELQAYMCENCFCTFISGDPHDPFLQFYDRLAKSFFKVWKDKKIFKGDLR
jgi:hypothetical protein